MSQVENTVEQARSAVASAGSLKELDQLEIQYLGRKGEVTQLLKQIGSLPPEDRAAFGQRVNAAKAEVAAAMEQRREELGASQSSVAAEIDVTLPGRLVPRVTRHPLTETIQEIKDIFIGLGFEVVESPDIEEYRFNFGHLNYPPDHPAMDEQMSFFIDDEHLLRTQTTAVQGRVFQDRKPPMRICTIGRCYRYEAVDATHGHTFMQVDCFAVDRDITLADLKGTLGQFAHEMFGEVETRFRRDFFPFVEPGADFAVKWKGRWLELGGAGMIHPNVLRMGGIDPEEWTGFAFGLGVERMPMVKRGINDLRLFYENGARFLRQF
ncbi:MAG: phenylalanine--tRNA ligase subunit alpha [Armatimonadetes bacterium]|nr:phenylalanine--tRNA ligase subunit alpha [Armatimonadota bacterium]